MRSEGFVHVWLPDATDPIVCGRLTDVDGELRFLYGRSYLDRDEAIALDPRELPLRPGVQRPPLGGVHSVIRDAAPDAWGRRCLLARSAEGVPLSELDYLVGAGPDRIGALTVAPTVESAETSATALPTLDDLAQAAASVEEGLPLPAELELALLHGTSVGGARPKALLDAGDRKWVAKFSSSSDAWPVVRCEHAAMELAARCGLDVPEVELTECLGKDVLLVERFDRVRATDGWRRRQMVSGLTALQLHESEARLASYLDLAGFLRRFGTTPMEACRELFRRMVFSILVGNTDDHARNHAFFWDGRLFELAPAYDLTPMLRAGRTTMQAMVVGRDGRRATLRNALSEAGQFGLDQATARDLQEELVETVRAAWPETAERSGLTKAMRAQLERETVLGPGCFE